MIHIGLLADNDSILPVARAATAPHACVGLAWTSQPEVKEHLEEAAADTQIVPTWDQLLLAKDLNVCIASGVSPAVVSAVKQLSQQRTHVVILAQHDPSSLYEFTSIWQDRPEQISALFLSGVSTVAAQTFHQFQKVDKLADGTGIPWKVEFHRHLVVAGDASRESVISLVESWLLKDLDWIVEAVGLPQRVTMVASGPDESSPREFTILLTRTQSPEVKLTCELAARDEWTLTLSGAKSSTTASCVNSQRPTISGISAEEWSLENTLTADAREAIQQWDAQGPQSPRYSWQRAIQLGEIGAAARKSWQRRRTVDIHFEETSERNQFKSQMTAVGCGTLLWVLFGTVALLLFAGLVDPRDRIQRQAESADFVISDDEFAAGSNALTQMGEEHVQKIIRNWDAAAPVVVIEATSENKNDAARRAEVLERFDAAGIRDADSRLAVRPLEGVWFERAMIAAWVCVFLPLAAYLLLQLLIAAARSPDHDVAEPKRAADADSAG